MSVVFFTLILGLSGRYFVPVEDPTEETLWNNGGECEESFEGIQKLNFFFLVFLWGARFLCCISLRNKSADL